MFAIAPSGNPSAHPHTSTPSSASGTVTSGSKLETEIRYACEMLARLFLPGSNEDEIKGNLKYTWIAVHGALFHAGDSNQKARLRNMSEFDAYVRPGSNGERDLLQLVGSMAKQQVPWRNLFYNEAFLIPEPRKREIDLDTDLATKNAWSDKYKGNLTGVLRETIAAYLSRDRTPYARLTTIVNSSGTGKSRMVGKLGWETITVPMCLRQPRRQGFPPVDADLRDYFVYGSGDRATARNKLHGFLYSLLMITRKRLETIAEKQDIPALPPFEKVAPEDCVPLVIDRQKKLATAFHEHMTEGQSYHAHNFNRRTFYGEVIAGAEQYVEKCHQFKSKIEREREPHGQHVWEHKDPKKAGQMLCHFIDAHYVLDSNKGPRCPLIVLAFDEADALTDSPPDNKHWNLFSELCQILHQINELPIFSLFLSTAARFNIFSPNIYSDPSVASSAQVRQPDYRFLDPISEISFDDIAYPALKGTITIGDVVKIGWISHLGRPLFGSFWDNLPRRCKDLLLIMDYVKQKLLDGPIVLENDNRAGSLACLSTRFALEFNVDTPRNVTHAQVERHMRLCITATPGLENLITIPASEPILAEASYELMKNGMNAVCHLARHADLNCIDRGRRGELVAALLFMQAYDAARKLSRGRSVSVANFMEALLPSAKYKTLLGSAPTSWPMNHPDNATFEEIFKDYGMWFNHVIKVESKEMISIDHLWKFVMRGAFILCATNQEGIDIVLPVCHMTQTLGPDSVTAVVIQVKNAADYKAALQGHLFDAMDSIVRSGIFSEVDRDLDSDSKATTLAKTPAESNKKKRKLNTERKAVIRIVFALASPEAAVVFREQSKKKYCLGGFTTFDIWLAGLSDNTFKQIQDTDVGPYRTLLERSLTPHWHDTFKSKGVPQIGEDARKLRGARRRKMAPLTFAWSSSPSPGE